MVKPFTNPLALEWLVKADADYVTANRELRARKMPNYDAACFHAQQCVEKLLKSMMIHQGIVPPRSHDLSYLLILIRFQDETNNPRPCGDTFHSSCV